MRPASAYNALILGAYRDQELPAEQVLESAKHLKRVLVIGETDNGELQFIASTGDRRWSRQAATTFVRKLLAESSG